MEVTRATIESGLVELGLRGQNIAVHSSLRSFGHVVGGAETVIEALLNTCATVLMPSFCGVGRTNPPPDDRPSQNGWTYNDYKINTDGLSAFDPATFDTSSEIDVEDMGVIPATFLKIAGTIRSAHPSVSWSANGPSADLFVSGHDASDPNRPLKELMNRQGYVLLLGVGLTECTAIHLAEEMAGRRPFVRWVLFSDGQVRRIREYGCSDGFDELAPLLDHHASEGTGSVM
jgi:aminoglycoside N3'-acetyltransferase